MDENKQYVNFGGVRGKIVRKKGNVKLSEDAFNVYKNSLKNNEKSSLVKTGTYFSLYK